MPSLLYHPDALSVILSAAKDLKALPNPIPERSSTSFRITSFVQYKEKSAVSVWQIIL